MAAPLSYTRSQILLHWLIAALVLYQILFHDGIEALWRGRMTGALPNEPTPTPHAAIGLLILLLMVWRIALRIRRGAPLPPENEHAALKRVAGGAHLLFYLLLVALPVSGAVAWFAGLEPPAELHGLAGKALIALVVLHVAAALAHQFWFRSDVLLRMTLRRPAGEA